MLFRAGTFLPSFIYLFIYSGSEWIESIFFSSSRYRVCVLSSYSSFDDIRNPPTIISAAVIVIVVVPSQIGKQMDVCEFECAISFAVRQHIRDYLLKQRDTNAIFLFLVIFCFSPVSPSARPPNTIAKDYIFPFFFVFLCCYSQYPRM